MASSLVVIKVPSVEHFTHQMKTYSPEKALRKREEVIRNLALTDSQDQRWGELQRISQVLLRERGIDFDGRVHHD